MANSEEGTESYQTFKVMKERNERFLKHNEESIARYEAAIREHNGDDGASTSG
jgi:hypothetical protein